MIRPSPRPLCNGLKPAPSAPPLVSDGSSWRVAGRRLRPLLSSSVLVPHAVLFLLLLSTTTVLAAAGSAPDANTTLHRRNHSHSSVNDASHKSLLYSTREDLLSRATESVSTSADDLNRKRHVVSLRAGNSSSSGERRQVLKKDPGLVTKVIRRRKVFHIPADLVAGHGSVHTSVDSGEAAGNRVGSLSNGPSSSRFDEFVAAPFLALLNTSHFSLQPEFLLAQGVGGNDQEMQPFRDFGMKLDSSSDSDVITDSEDVSSRAADILRRHRVLTSNTKSKSIPDEEGFDLEVAPSTESVSFMPKVVVRRKKIRVNITRDRMQTTRSESKPHLSIEATTPVSLTDQDLVVVDQKVDEQASQNTKSYLQSSTTTLLPEKTTESIAPAATSHVPSTTVSLSSKTKLNKAKSRQRDRSSLAVDTKKTSKSSGVIDSVLSIVRPRSRLAPSMLRLHSVSPSTSSPPNDTSLSSVGVSVERKISPAINNRRFSLSRAQSTSKSVVDTTTTSSSTTKTTTVSSPTTTSTVRTLTARETEEALPLESTERYEILQQQQSDHLENSSSSKRKLNSLSSRRLERYRQRQQQRLNNIKGSDSLSTTQSTPTSTVSKEKSEVAKVLGLIDRLRNRRRKQSGRHRLTNRLSDKDNNTSSQTSYVSPTTEASLASAEQTLNQDKFNLVSSSSHLPNHSNQKTLPEYLQNVPSNLISNRKNVSAKQVRIANGSKPENRTELRTTSKDATLENAEQSSRKDIFIRSRVIDKFAKAPHISIDNSNLLARRLQERKHSFSSSLSDVHAGAGQSVLKSVLISSTLSPLAPVISSFHRSSRINIIPTTPSSHLASKIIAARPNSTKPDRRNNLSHHSDPILDIAPIFVWKSSFPLAGGSYTSTVPSTRPSVVKDWKQFPQSYQIDGSVDDSSDFGKGSASRQTNHIGDEHIRYLSPIVNTDSPVVNSIKESTTEIHSSMSDDIISDSSDESELTGKSTVTSPTLLPTLPHQPIETSLFELLGDGTEFASNSAVPDLAETTLETTTATSPTEPTVQRVLPANALRPVIELLEVDLEGADEDRQSAGSRLPQDSVFRVELALEKGAGAVENIDLREGSGSRPIYLVSLLFVVPVLAVAMWYFRNSRSEIHRALPKRLKSALWTAHVDEFRGDFSDGHTSSSDDHLGKALSNVETLSRIQTRWQIARRCLKLQHMLGEGNFGQVWKAEADNLRGHGGTMVVAVKNVKDSATHKEKQDLLRELRIMAEMGTHPNIVTLLGCCTHSEPFLLVMEYVVFGKLLTYLRENRGRHNYFNVSHDSSALTSRDLTMFAHQVASAMEFISSKQIVHRDLAARNVLVHYDKTCKVCDFGMSRSMSEINVENFEPKHRGALPIRWMSPESLYYNTYNQKTDCWSYGILLWEIITLGSTPYPGLSAREVVRAVGEGYRLERPDHCHPQLYQLATSCWTAEAALRPDFRQLRQQIEILLTNDRYGYVDLERFQEEIYATLNKSSDEKL